MVAAGKGTLPALPQQPGHGDRWVAREGQIDRLPEGRPTVHGQDGGDDAVHAPLQRRARPPKQHIIVVSDLQQDVSACFPSRPDILARYGGR